MAHGTSSDYLKLPVGSGHLKSSAGFGKREDYTYDVPDQAVWASLDYDDMSGNTISLGSGSGKVSLRYEPSEKKAYVHAWVNGSAFFWAHNEMKWTVYAWMPKK